jgi:hypothetical protein
MHKSSFLLTWCFALFSYGTMVSVDGLTASASDLVDVSGTDVCGSCSTDVCSCGVSACEQCYLFPQSDCGLNLRGWVAGGFVGNTSGPTSKFNGPYNAIDRANEPMANQVYMIGERVLPQCDWGLGGRVDVLYGLDYNLAQSLGFETTPDVQPRWNSSEYYGLAVPQAYANIGTQDFSFQVGHFYSIVGYEGLMAPDNFFYTKSYSYQFAGPFQHWGGQMNWNLNESWTVQLGLVNGWDALDRMSDNAAVIGRLKYLSLDTGIWTSFALINGKEFNNAAGLNIPNDYANRTRYSWLVGLPLTCRMDYVFHQWLGAQADGAVGGGTAYWYGLDQYLTYALNDCWKAGMRFEWFRDEDGTRVGLNRRSNPNKAPFAGNFYSASAGLNWKPTCNFTLRPEIRYDWYDGDAQRLPYDDGTDSNQLLLGLDAILLY